MCLGDLSYPYELRKTNASRFRIVSSKWVWSYSPYLGDSPIDSLKFDCRKSVAFFWGGKCFYRAHALVYPDRSFRTCCGPEAFTSATIFSKCSEKVGSGWQEPSIKKVYLELLYLVYECTTRFGKLVIFPV